MSAGFIDKFSADSAAYRAGRPTYPSELIAEIAGLAPGRDLAWDCGTGSGQAARGLRAHFDRVFATDASPQQIAQAEPAPGVDYAVEPAERSSLGAGSVDLVLAAQCLHWFDRDRFYTEVERVLRPGGVLAAIGYDWMCVGPELDRVIDRHFLARLREYWAPENDLISAGYRSIPFPGAEIRLGPFAIYRDWDADQFLAYVLSWSAVRALRDTEGETALDAAIAAIRDAWGTEPRRVVMPLHVRVARLNQGVGRGGRP